MLPYRFSTMKISLSPGTPDLCTSNSHNPLPQNWGKLVKGKMTSVFWEGSDLISPHSYDKRKQTCSFMVWKVRKIWGKKSMESWLIFFSRYMLSATSCWFLLLSLLWVWPIWSTKLDQNVQNLQDWGEVCHRNNKKKTKYEYAKNQQHQNTMIISVSNCFVRRRLVRDAIGDIFAHGQHDLLGVVQLLQQHGHLCWLLFWQHRGKNGWKVSVRFHPQTLVKLLQISIRFRYNNFGPCRLKRCESPTYK